MVSYEEQYGGIVLDPTGAADYLSGPSTDRRSFHFSPLSSATMSPLYLQMYLLKSHLMLRIIEERIGQTLLLQVSTFSILWFFLWKTKQRDKESMETAM